MAGTRRKASKRVHAANATHAHATNSHAQRFVPTAFCTAAIAATIVKAKKVLTSDTEP